MCAYLHSKLGSVTATSLAKVGFVCMNTRKSKHKDNTYKQVSASVVDTLNIYIICKYYIYEYCVGQMNHTLQLNRTFLTPNK